ncbi:MAG: hypothetical protein NTY88_11125 [Bacteroidetes bacterium]|nr:hypothetical protein [Bacteroidota bacterium]
MKTFFASTFVLGVLIMSLAFTPALYVDSYKETGFLNATVNAHSFELREKDFYRAMLVKKSNPLATSPESKNRTVACLTFFGNDTSTADHSPFSENLSIEFNFSNLSEAEVNNAIVELHYDMADYYILPEENHFAISKTNWSADKSYFLLDAQFEFHLRKQGFPFESQPVVTLKGNLRDVNVSVPPWIASKINADIIRAN